MRIRRVCTGAALGALAVVVVPGAAFAAVGPDPTEEEIACVATEVEAGSDPETVAGCVDKETVEAPNPILPEPKELIPGAILFLGVLFVLVKFAFPFLRQGLEQRETRIREDLERAEQARLAAEEEQRRYEAQLADARGEAARILEEAREAADQARRDVLARAEEDAGEIRGRAEDDVRLARERAMAELRSSVGALSIELAERIVERNLDRDTQMALVESYIEQVGSN